MTQPRHENPVPKALYYGLFGGILLLTIILIGIFLSRDKSPPLDLDQGHSSESRSASPPQ